MRNQQMIQKTLEWIESMLETPLNTQQVSDISGYSHYHFQRFFKQMVGMTVSDYIRTRRLANAASALIHSNDRIIDIAFSYQFQSQETFTRAFKKAYGLPPGQYRVMMRDLRKKEEKKTMTKQINGWFMSGSHPMHYRMAQDDKVVHQGKSSGRLKSVSVKQPEEFGTMMQQFKADRYRNERLKLSGFLKTEDVDGLACLWMRIDSSSGDILSFDNMSGRSIEGTTGWNHYSIVLDVPTNSAVISFGVILSGKGTVWVDGLSFETVDETTPVTAMDLGGHLLDEPTNLTFDA